MSFFDRFRPAPKISVRDVDPDALTVIHRLHRNGHVAYLVGGGVRDILLGRTPKDFDVVTDARPNQIKRLFRNAFIIGRRFRLALIRFGEKQIETATFRRDPDPDDAASDPSAEGGLYQMSDNVFGTPEEDALRRDFTVNALFFDPDDERVIDYVGGLRDLRKRVLRCIGDPNVRFREDPVRMLRAVRLSSRLDFTIHPDSLEAIRRYGSEISAASKPRLFEEVLRLFTFARSREAFLRLHETGLMAEILPAVADQVERSGGRRAPLWDYLRALDDVAGSLEVEDRASPRYVQENALRLAVLLAPLFRERLAAAPSADPPAVADSLVGEVVVAPFMTRGWRVPRLLCSDLTRILESLVRYPSRLPRHRTQFRAPWLYTAIVFWGIAAEAEGDRSVRGALDAWRARFDAYASGPHPARRGTYVPTDPDSVGERGFPGDVPEDRDALFPGDRLRGRRSPRSRRDDAPSPSPAPETPPPSADAAANPADASGTAPVPDSVQGSAPTDASLDPDAPRRRRRRRRGGRRHHRRPDGSSPAPDSP